MLRNLNWMEIVVIVVLLVILFGSSKIPGMMKNLANGVKTFKKEMKSDEKEPVAKVADAPVKKQTPKSKPAAKKVATKKPAGRKVASAKKTTKK